MTFSPPRKWVSEAIQEEAEGVNKVLVGLHLNIKIRLESQVYFTRSQVYESKCKNYQNFDTVCLILRISGSGVSYQSALIIGGLPFFRNIWQTCKA